MRALKTPWQENRRHHNCNKSLFFAHWQRLTLRGDEHHWPEGNSTPGSEGEQPQPGLILCGPWHLQVTHEDLGKHLPCVVQQLSVPSSISCLSHRCSLKL